MTHGDGQRELAGAFSEFIAARDQRPDLTLEDWMREASEVGQVLPTGLLEMRDRLARLAEEMVAGVPRHADSTTGGSPSSDGDDLRSGLRVGVRVGPYVLECKIGSGGMGEVWRARDSTSGELVAIKFLAAGRYDTEGLERFAREAKTGTAIQHENIVATLDTGEEAGVPWIAFEYVPGGLSLASTIRHMQGAEALTTSWFERVATWTRDLALAAHTVHEAGYIHRDIKPSNVLLDARDKVMMADFGLTTFSGATTLTSSGARLGTYAYMSPEHVQGEAVDASSDVFSLGAVLYELLTLKKPFEGENPVEIGHKIVSQEVENPCKSSSAVPTLLAAIAVQALQKEKDCRYPSALAMAEDLNRYLQGESVLASRLTFGRRVQTWTRKRKRLLRDGMVVLVGIVILMTVSRFVGRDSLAAFLEERRHEGLLFDLLNKSELLYPALPAKQPEFEQWLKGASELEKALPDHEGELNRLREKGKGNAKSEVIEEVRLGAQTELDSLRQELRHLMETWDREEQKEPGTERPNLRQRIERAEGELRTRGRHILSQLEQLDGLAPSSDASAERLLRLVNLVVGIRVIVESDGLQEGVRRRYRFLRRVTWDSLESPPSQSAWKEAIRSIQDETLCPLYRGLQITPQLGLFPLGQDCESGLWEFAHLETGSVPIRDPTNGAIDFDEETAIVLVLIPAIELELDVEDGNVGDQGLVDVSLDPFFLSKYELGQQQWQRVRAGQPKLGPAYFFMEDEWMRPLHPVENISWIEARKFAAWIDLSLPTAAQHYAATRAGSDSEWWTGDDELDIYAHENLLDQSFFELGVSSVSEASNDNDGFPFHAPIHMGNPNPFGLVHIGGNVSEWCEDRHSTYYAGLEPGTGLRITEDASDAIVRGGNWWRPAGWAKSKQDWRFDPAMSEWFIGVRLARRLDK